MEMIIKIKNRLIAYSFFYMLIYTMLDNNTYLLFFLHIEEDGNKNATYNKRYFKKIYMT